MASQVDSAETVRPQPGTGVFNSSKSAISSPGDVLRSLPSTGQRLARATGLAERLIPRGTSRQTTAATLLARPTPLDSLLSNAQAQTNAAPATIQEALQINPVMPAIQSAAATGLAVGSEGPAVRALQHDLQRAGFSPGAIDGDFGNGTLRAVQIFQENRIETLNNQLSGNLPPLDREVRQAAVSNLQRELDKNVAGAHTENQLTQVIAARIPADYPVNTNLQTDSSGYIDNDPRITAIPVPALENGAFGDPINDIDNIVLHRTVNNTTEQTLTSFATEREDGNNYGTHFIVGRDGSILQTASLNQRTAHVRGHNSSSIGIEVVGMPLDSDGNQTGGPPGNAVASWEPLTPEQTEAVAYLTNSLNSYYGLESNTVEAHEDLQAKTEGEGRTVYNAIEGLLAP